jgi:hypothetical protein
MTDESLTQDLVREFFSYDPHDGVLSWRARPSKGVHVGDVAGAINAAGYRVTQINGKKCMCIDSFGFSILARYRVR